MPIRTKPWSEVTLQDVVDLIPREIREDATIEFKRQLDIDAPAQRYEFLKDVSAMANGVGGTIIFGAVEGDGEQRGQIVDVRGQALDPDAVQLTLTNILNDGLDERLHGVLIKMLPAGDPGNYVCVMRIPASPLSPHRITSGAKSQFYLRGNVSNQPMNTGQLRAMFLQRDAALIRAQALVDERTARLKAVGSTRYDDLHFGTEPFTNPDQVVLHVIPLFPHPGGWRLGPERQRRLMSVPALGANTPYEAEFYALEGLYSRYQDRRHVLFMRAGGIEFQRYDVLDRRRAEGAPPELQAWDVEMDVLRALAECAKLTEDGFLPLPLVVSLRLLDVGGSTVQVSPRDHYPSRHLQDEADVHLTPVILHAWGVPAAEQMRQVFDEMFQAWHVAASSNFYPDGDHHEYDGDGRVIPRVPAPPA